MPYGSARSQGTLMVQQVGLFITVDKEVVVPGDTVTFTCQLLTDGYGWAGQMVEVKHYPTGKVIGRDVTNSAGIATIKWTVPFKDRDLGKLPCTYKEFFAYTPELGFSSGRVTVAIAHEVHIYDLAISPKTVQPGGQFQVSGYLVYIDEEGMPRPLAGKTVEIRIDGNVVDRVTTGSDGSFSSVLTAPSETGSYTIEAYYAGEGL